MMTQKQIAKKPKGNKQAHAPTMAMLKCSPSPLQYLDLLCENSANCRVERFCFFFSGVARKPGLPHSFSSKEWNLAKPKLFQSDALKKRENQLKPISSKRETRSHLRGQESEVSEGSIIFISRALSSERPCGQRKTASRELSRIGPTVPV